MGMMGMVIGGCLGHLLAGVFGAVGGAYVGNLVENCCTKRRSPGGDSPLRFTGSTQDRELVFCACAAAMLAKLAKADGRVSRPEIVLVERAFERLGFSGIARNYAVNVFRKAKDDAHSVYEYAAEFAAVVSSVEVRELFYGLLWDLACADSTVAPAELEILRNITRPLGIRSGWFDFFADERLRRGASGGGRDAPSAPRDELAEAYAVLGVSSADDDETVRRAYREKAKKCHPDALRAQGLPDEMIGKATDMMAKVNGAWACIRAARGL